MPDLLPALTLAAPGSLALGAAALAPRDDAPVLAGFCCPATIVAAGVVAVHHLALNLVMPAAVFPGGGDLLRVVMHAVIRAVEGATRETDEAAGDGKGH